MQVGNKAQRLAVLSDLGFCVPEFFVVLPAVNQAHPTVTTEDFSSLDQAAADLGGSQFAVRSSSTEEDSADKSFAGQFDSFLNVPSAAIALRVKDVMASVNNAHLHVYKEAQGNNDVNSLPAVIVQRMVAADSAGVAFATDPISGDDRVTTVAAIKGLGDRLVSGASQGDTWRVDERERILERTLEHPEATAALSDKQLKRVVRLVRKVSRQIGKPQDIEWAFCGRKLYLLQSRDITSSKKWSLEAEQFGLWDNSNIVESYGGVTTPLTFSVARTAYREAYQHYCKVVGVSAQTIRDNERAFDEMIGMIRGRVYYNLLNWYRLLMLTPGFRFNSKFMEQMMGVTEGLPENVLPRGDSGGRFAWLRAIGGFSRVATRMLWRLYGHDKNVRDFHARVDKALVPLNFDPKNTEQLLEEFDRLQAAVIPHWDTPLLNDMYCMIFHGVLRSLTGRWLPESCADVHNELVSGEAGIISLEPVRLMKEMAEEARTLPQLASLMREASQQDIEREMAKYGQVLGLYDNYLERFGDRCIDELKLESATMQDDALPLLRAVGQMALSPAGKTAAGDSPRLAAELRVEREFSGKPLKYAIYRRVLGIARARVRDRENMRFERTRVYGRVRQIFLALGQRFEALNAIECRDDIFFLDVSEVRGYIRGNGTLPDLRATIAMRRKDYRTFNEEQSPPRRFVTQGPVQLASSLRPVASTADGPDSLQRKGQACSPGVVRGRVKIVRDPRSAVIEKGDILVAERTDPGWVTIFPLVSGLIMERGSLLSHSAIVARELAIPAVVGVEGACAWLHDGELVELNGALGTVRRLDAGELAA